MNSKQLHEKRMATVPNGVGVFNQATAMEAHGAHIVDAEGRKLIDFAGGIGVVNSGHGPEPVVKAIQQQAARMIHTSFNVTTYPVYMELAEKLIELFPHGPSTKVMLTTTGAESVENAIKIARQATGRSAVLCYTNGFHGRSMMAMSLTSKTAIKSGCGPYAPEVYRLPFPNFYQMGKGMSLDAFCDQEIERLHDAFNTMVESKQVAAIIVEPVQGEAGFHVVPQPYMQALREICTEHGIMLILDEVQTGFGRTGKWAAYEHFGVTPDLSTWAKSMGGGMPIGCVIGRAEVMDAAGPSTIGGTYPGNPVCAAACLANINYMQDININALGEKVGQRVRERFLEMQQKCPAIGDVRGLGAMMAFELVKDGDPMKPNGELCGKLTQACLDRGLIVISAGTYKNVIRVLSPLVIENDELDRGLDIIEEELMKLTGTPPTA